jgi:hypothetical protein
MPHGDVFICVRYREQQRFVEMILACNIIESGRTGSSLVNPHGMAREGIPVKLAKPVGLA